MIKFEVQEFCLCGGWTNTWSDENGLTTFDSLESAQAELDEYFNDMQYEVEAGNMQDMPDKAEFRIMEVLNEL